MSVVATALRELMALGVTGEALAAAIERIEEAAYEERQRSLEEAVCIASQRADEELSAGARRTRRWRERKAAEASQTVTECHETSQTVTNVTASEAPEIGTPFSEENIPPSPPKGGSSPTGDRSLAKPPRRRREGSRFCPADFEPSPDHHAQAAARGLSPGEFERALSRFRRHEFPRPYTDWSRCFANWIDREKPDDRQSPRTKSDHLAAISRAMAEAVGGPDRAGGYPPEPGAGGGVPALRSVA